MANPAAVNAKHEKILRGLLKLEGNRRCMTCEGSGSLAPQYACVSFGTFVCTTCSGVQYVPAHCPQKPQKVAVAFAGPPLEKHVPICRRRAPESVLGFRV
jgi:hypothetical protein